VVNLNLPGLKGLELLEEFRERPALAGTKLLLVRPTLQSEDVLEGVAGGRFGSLLKPFRPSELWEAVWRALGWAPPSAGASAAGSGSPRPRGLRVLLVEDNLANRQVALRLLEREGYRVVVSGNGKEALKALENEPFDLVLMDVQMPEMDGLEAAAAIRAKERQTGSRVPILAMTAHAMKGDEERCLRAGMDAYIAKPIQAATLFESIGRLCPQAVPSGPEANPEVVDPQEALGSLAGDRQLLLEIAAIFIRTYPEQVQAIRDALERKSAPELAAAAHSLKGSAGSLAAKSVFDAARRLEERGLEGRLDGAAEDLRALEVELARLVPLLERLRQEQGVTA